MVGQGILCCKDAFNNFNKFVKHIYKKCFWTNLIKFECHVQKLVWAKYSGTFILALPIDLDLKTQSKPENTNIQKSLHEWYNSSYGANVCGVSCPEGFLRLSCMYVFDTIDALQVLIWMCLY